MTNKQNIITKLKQFIKTIQDNSSEEINSISNNDLLFENGVLDSSQFVELLTFIEKEFGFHAPDKDISLDHFSTLERITSYICNSVLSEKQEVKVNPIKKGSKVIWTSSKNIEFSSSSCQENKTTLKNLRQETPVLFDLQLKLFKFFDLKFLDIAKSLNAVEYRYPSLISKSTLERCDYFQNFPNTTHFVSTYRNKKGVTNSIKNYSMTEYALSPAVCFHCYEQLKEQSISLKKGTTIFTARGKCFRNEEKGFSDNGRYREFTMREIVFFGAKETVKEIRCIIIDKAIQTIKELQLMGKIEQANDPFFKKTPYQQIQELKYEALLWLPQTKKFLAVASFNLHENFFAHAFNIKSTDKDISLYTGCAAFGLERWVNVFLSQYGLNFSRWPTELKNIADNENK